MAEAIAVKNGMTPAETRHLTSLERKIERGLTTFREVGEALADIRDNRLYRSTHASFELYCSERWGLERQRAYQLMAASEVVQTLGEVGNVVVNEAQARELVPLLHADPSSMSRAVEKAQESGPLTAPNLRKAVQEVAGQPERTQTPRTPTVDSLLSRIRALEPGLQTFAESKPKQEDLDRVREVLQKLMELLA